MCETHAEVPRITEVYRPIFQQQNPAEATKAQAAGLLNFGSHVPCDHLRAQFRSTSLIPSNIKDWPTTRLNPSQKPSVITVR